MKLKRANGIIEYIKSYKICTYEDLCKQFNASLSTIRRDIDELEKQGKIVKVHGGIQISDNYVDEANETSLFKFDYTRDKIASAASKLVEDGDIILLGSGSTVAHMIRHLKNKRNITLITNNLAVLNETLDCDFNVVSIGGNLDKIIMSFVGLQTSKQIEDLNANKCFISCNGISLHAISNVADMEAAAKKAQIQISDKTILMADHSKFDTKSLYSFATLNDIDYLITDENPGKKYEDLCKKSKCELVIAE